MTYEELKKIVSEKENEISTLNVTIENKDGKSNDLSNEVEELKKTISEKEGEISTLQSANEELNNSLKNKEEEINAISDLINEGSKCGIQIIMNLNRSYFPHTNTYNIHHLKGLHSYFYAHIHRMLLECKLYHLKHT